MTSKSGAILGMVVLTLVACISGMIMIFGLSSGAVTSEQGEIWLYGLFLGGGTLVVLFFAAIMMKHGAK